MNKKISQEKKNLHIFQKKGKKNINAQVKQKNTEVLRKTLIWKKCISLDVDDFLIFTSSKENAEKIKIATVKWLKENLKLECSFDKTKIIDLQNEFSEFLGFKFKISNRVKETSKGSKKNKRKVV